MPHRESDYKARGGAIYTALIATRAPLLQTVFIFRSDETIIMIIGYATKEAGLVLSEAGCSKQAFTKIAAPLFDWY